MPKRRQKEQIICTHFVWLLGQRDGVFTADGRSNKHPLGRHSLGTKDRDQALETLRQLDLVMAVKIGKVDRSVLEPQAPDSLSLTAGWELYRSYVSRTRVTGGAKPTTQKRYRAVFEKFIAFAERRGFTSWNQVNRSLLEAYADWLDGEGYAYATEYIELTTLKQAIKWFIEGEHLPAACLIKGLRMQKPTETDTYCWSVAEVEAMIRHCREHGELNWLGNVLLALACAGLRISELRGLRWTDVDFERNVIILTDESTRAARRRRREARETKNSRSRTFPINPELQPVLQRLPRSADGRVFHGPRGGILKPDTVRRILVRDVLKKLEKRFPTPTGEIGFADGRLHSFRHYFCSVCANSGVPEQVVMNWLGHQSSRITKRYYHLHDQEAQRQMKQVRFVDHTNSRRKRSAG